ncbi:MAG TPA: hypothetical protein VFP59_13270 [Candidatus Angelobacter sp.]|nr:hypothetical protein [Candidatus Angelobacter sp.]
MSSQICWPSDSEIAKGATQLWFQYLSRIFNSKVKNSVENALITKVTARQTARFHALHWIGCDYEFLVNFKRDFASGGSVSVPNPGHCFKF